MPHSITEPARAGAPRGQVLVIFAFLLTILIGMAAFVVDMAWIWSHQLQVQRAADAGALAGVVHLPSDPDQAESVAMAESRKNGYRHNVGGVQIDARPDPSFSRRMIVTVSAPVNTFFMGLFGFDEVTVTRSSRAEYILPVPMGSPQNYLGVGDFTDAVTTTTTTTSTSQDDDETDWEHAGLSVAGAWTFQSGGGRNMVNVIDDNDNAYTWATADNQQHVWTNFGLQSGIPNPAANQVLSIRGIEVRLTDAHISAACANTKIAVQLSNNSGAAYMPITGNPAGIATPNLPTNTSNGDYTLGSSTNQWGHPTTWTRPDFADGTFRVRLTADKGCTQSRQIRLDELEVRVHYRMVTTTTTTTTTTTIEDVNIRDPYDVAELFPQRFWTGMQSQGAPARQGDAFMTQYDPSGNNPRTDAPNSNYCPFLNYCTPNPEGFYNYAIEIPSNGGEIWVFDPGFCDVGTTEGVRENWTIGGTNGASSSATVSAFFRLYNTQQTAWDFTDDVRVDSQSGNSVSGESQPSTFRRGAGNNSAKYYDPDLRSEPSGSGYSSCENQSWHNDWWQIGSGLPAGIYRLHTTSHDRISTSDQSNTTALNAFAIWASAGGAGNINNVKVYGLGAMEAYFPLEPSTSSRFYLAQIEAIHANKWVDISLWDPGDTANLTADLSILMPTGAGYQAVPFYYNSVAGTTIPDNFTCGPGTSSSVNSIRTNNGGGGGGIYNGQWLRLCFQLPANYSAPIPPADSLTPPNGQGPGWFRIQYAMGGGSSNATDLTTWKVEVRGNPVHLITPGDDVASP